MLGSNLRQEFLRSNNDYLSHMQPYKCSFSTMHHAQLVTWIISEKAKRVYVTANICHKQHLT